MHPTPTSSAQKRKGGLIHGKEACRSSSNTSPLSRSVRRSAAMAASAQTLIGLKLNKLHRTSTLADTPSVRGMIEKVKHLVRVVSTTERGAVRRAS